MIDRVACREESAGLIDRLHRLNNRPAAPPPPPETGFIWREYGRADARWAVRDATVISLELLTGTSGLMHVLVVLNSQGLCD